jgi:hypothetical protein
MQLATLAEEIAAVTRKNHLGNPPAKFFCRYKNFAKMRKSMRISQSQDPWRLFVTH